MAYRKPLFIWDWLQFGEAVRPSTHAMGINDFEYPSVYNAITTLRASSKQL